MLPLGASWSLVALAYLSGRPPLLRTGTRPFLSIRESGERRAQMKNAQAKTTQLDRIEVELHHQNAKLDRILRVIVRRRRTRARRDADDTAARKNRARVIAAIRDICNRRGLSVPKAIRRLRRDAKWSARMKGVADRSWESYYYVK